MLRTVESTTWGRML